MHVLLVQPSVSAEPAYPLALAGIIPLLEAAGHTVSGVDLCFEGVETILTAVEHGEVDWVVATVLHHNAPSVMTWMAPLKGRVQTAVAGALPTLDPHGALALTGADFALVGPPEETLTALINAGDRRPPAGVVSRHAPDLEPRLPTPFALLPAPDRRVFPVERYSHAMRSTANPYTQVVTSRGCRRHCPYCTVPAMRPTGFDPRSPEAVVAEWAALVHDHGVRSIHVEDDSFLADPDRVRRICEGIHKAGLTVSWELVNGIRVDQVNPNLLDTMAQAGCNRLVYSFEHINPNHSPAIGHSQAEAAAAVSWARECKMRVGGYFIVGLPGESLASTIESIHLALRLRLDDANWIPFYESPGSGFAGCATSIDATTIRRSTATRLAKLATLAFFANPQTFGQLWSEIAATPATLPALAHKALELLRTGGPVPLRDTP
jgi:radical SAM superfamily enzyme YgiQ (UPF0313 family)